MYWILGAIITGVLLVEILLRRIKDPSQYEQDLENSLNPYDSYYIAKDEQRHKGMKFTAVVIAILITLALVSFFSSCAVLPRSTHYQYEYVRLWDGTKGTGSDRVLYDIGDTIHEIPSGRMFLIVGIGLPGEKMIYAQTKFEK